mmetsp:Transcript_1951/g.3722  ORF Transcript_1951/g.3722 Transcript_1951/m.3722 type:complete len:319 (+) Transcript_1951:881-1837(+)
MYGTYAMYLTRNFIENSTTMRWCPSAGCTKVALKEDNADNDITVTCTECCSQFCFRCGKPDHTMLSCEMLEAWQIQCNSDMENYLWIVSNTKKCPKCKNRIEKNGGCMHMSCKMCRHGFCWHCLEPWEAKGHTWNHANCSFHMPEDTNTEKDDKTPAEMERFIRYFSRYDGHDKSIKIADTQRELVLERMNMLMGKAGSSGVYMDVDFLIQAVEQIIAGRKGLKDAYAFLYFLVDGSPQKELLENSLELIERHVESLSHLIETSRQSPIVADEKTVTDEKIASAEVLDRDRCLNLTSAIKKSLTTMLNTRAEQNFQYR